MIIVIATKNPTKVKALKSISKEYDFLKNLKILENPVNSEVSEQPKTLKETVLGAKNRAKKAYKKDSISFGIESGLMKVPYSNTGFMDVCATAIVYKNKFALGLSSAFECPKRIKELMIKKGLDMSQAAFETGLTKHKDIGSKQGLIGILTKNRLTRKEYTMQSIRTALIQIENEKLY